MLNWRDINSENPEIDQIVILSNEKITDFRNWELAQFLESDDLDTSILTPNIFSIQSLKSIQKTQPLEPILQNTTLTQLLTSTELKQS